MQYAGLQKLLRSTVAGSAILLVLPIEASAVGGRAETAEPPPAAAPAPSPAGQLQNGTSQIGDFKPITQDRLLKGTDDPSAWLMYGGSYDSTRFSPLADINRTNVNKLQAAWMFQTGVPAQFQASPVVADGIMYMTAAFNHVYALNAETGEMLWRYDHPLPSDMRVCCGPEQPGRGD